MNKTHTRELTKQTKQICHAGLSKQNIYQPGERPRENTLSKTKVKGKGKQET